MAELIVALDGDVHEMGAIFARLHRSLGLCWFKVGSQLLLQYSGMILIKNMLCEGDVKLMLDLKTYDTPDTVRNIARRAFEDLGVIFLTVHPTAEVMEAAMSVRPEGGAVLGVSELSSRNANGNWLSRYRRVLRTCDGAVCPFWLAGEPMEPELKDKLRVVPGIRPLGTASDNHVPGACATPRAAVEAGADYLVVGRPIWQADDPVGAAAKILAEMT